MSSIDTCIPSLHQDHMADSWVLRVRSGQQTKWMCLVFRSHPPTAVPYFWVPHYNTTAKLNPKLHIPNITDTHQQLSCSTYCPYMTARNMKAWKANFVSVRKWELKSWKYRLGTIKGTISLIRSCIKYIKWVNIIEEEAKMKCLQKEIRIGEAEAESLSKSDNIYRWGKSGIP